MQTNFLQFSQVIKNLTDEEASWFVDYIEHRRNGFDTQGKELEDDEKGTYPDFRFVIMQDENWGIYAWFFADDNGSVEQVAETVKEFLLKFRPHECFTMTWAEYAHEPRVEEFDGGAIFVTARDIKIFHAGEWAYNLEKAFSEGATL